MAKETEENVGAVTDGVSSQVESEIKEVVTEKIDPNLLNFAKDFIVTFAKRVSSPSSMPSQSLAGCYERLQTGM